ncbi:HAMP domain-containing protein [Oligoflexus tunisiensis]|uniref:HAMP domain-containing protein n=1 Tax=Oligoflexus tunisiensis TaxID=708132 RepID=UPI00114CD3EC|nr:HAMP domain-containing protein [Oligoflexus tunisiensis]
MTPMSIRKKLLFSSLGVAALVMLLVTLASIYLINRQYSMFLGFMEKKSRLFITDLQDSSAREQETIATESMEALRAKAGSLVRKDSLALGIALAENSIGFVRDYIRESVALDADVVEGAFYAVAGDRIDLWQYSTEALLNGAPLGSRYDKASGAWQFAGKSLPDPTLEEVLKSQSESIREVERNGTKHLDVSIQVVSETGSIGYIRYLLTTENISRSIAKAKKNLEAALAAEQAREEASAQLIADDGSRIKWVSFGMLALAVIISLGFTVVISNYVAGHLTDPIYKLEEGANRIANGDYDTPLAIHSNDEIGSLARNFDSMRQQVRDFTRDLQSLVEARTKDLAEELTRTQAILNTIEQGIITISGDDLLIDEKMSSYVAEIFQKPCADLVGRSLWHLLVEPAVSLDYETKSIIGEVLHNCMGESEFTFEVNRNKLPRDLTVHIAGEDRVYQVDWCPMLNEDGVVQRLLVAVKDLTAFKRSEAALKAEIEAQNRDITKIASIVSNSKESLLLFVSDMRRRLVTINNHLAESALDRRKEIYHELHTIKGQARSLKLSDIANETHIAEDMLKDHSGPDDLSLAQQVSRLVDIFDDYVGVISKKLGWSIDERGVDLTSLIFKEFCAFRSALVDKGITVRDLSIRDAVITWKDTVIADLRSIVTHLISNSIDHGYLAPFHDGNIRVGSLHFQATMDEESVEIILEDGGAGFNTDLIQTKAQSMGIDLSRFANPIEVVTTPEFSTTAIASLRSGRGVGLSAVKSIVDSYHGTMSLKNRSNGGGSCITIRIPAYRVVAGVTNEAAA